MGSRINKVTFFVIFSNPNHPDVNLRANLTLYNEDGIMIKDFGYGQTLVLLGIHLISNGKYRLSIFRSIINPQPYEATILTEIYSLPGNPPSGTASPRASVNQYPYPNPASSTITLPYQLARGEVSAMHIYSLNGQLIETKQIDATFDKILLNVSNYTKGTYLYEVNGTSNIFIIN